MKIMLKDGKFAEIDNIEDLYKNKGKTIVKMDGVTTEASFDRIYEYYQYPLVTIDFEDPKIFGIVVAPDQETAIRSIYQHITPIDAFGCLALLTMVERDFKKGTHMLIRRVECPDDLAQEIYTKWKAEEDANRPKWYSWIIDDPPSGYFIYGKRTANLRGQYSGIVFARNQEEARRIVCLNNSEILEDTKVKFKILDMNANYHMIGAYTE